MGEAKQRGDRLQKWIDRLEGEEAVIASVAHDTYRKFVRPTHLVGGCYLTSFFLHSFLRRERGVKTDLMVGWINDGTGSAIYRSEEHTSELQSRVDISYAVFC